MASVVLKDNILYDPNTDPTKTTEAYKIQEGNNIYPTFNGYRTGWGYSWLNRFTLDVGTVPLEFKELQDGKSALVITNNAIYYYVFADDSKTVVYSFASIPETSVVSIAYIGTYWYVLLPNRGLIKIDMINLIGQVVVLPVELVGELIHIATTDNRLILLTDKVVAQSALGDGSDFTTSLETGAGWVALSSLSNGSGLAVCAKSNGFVIFTTNNVITVKELDSALVYSYESVLSSVLYNKSCMVSGNEGKIYFLDTRLNLYSYEDKGALGAGGLQLVSPLLVNFFASKQITPIKLLLLDYDLLVVTDKGIFGVETLTGKLFKFTDYAFMFTNFAFDKSFNLFRYNRDYQMETSVAKNASYFGTRLHLDNEIRNTTMVMNASVEFFGGVPYYNNAISKEYLEGAIVFSGTEYLKQPLIIWYADLDELAVFNEDLDASSLNIDLNSMNITTGANVELSGNLIQVDYQENYNQTPIKAQMIFGALNFAPEVPIECSAVVTRIDTMTDSVGVEFFIDCRVNEPDIQLIDCDLVKEPNLILRGDLNSYDIKVTNEASTDSKGRLNHHIEVLTDTYYVGDRLVGNVYNTGVYHRVQYDIEGACEIKGVQFNLFKGGLVYDRS